MVRVTPQCHKEVSAFPEETRGEVADAAARLNEGHNLSMPLSRPMPSVGRGVHELRFRDRSGVYRVIYVVLRQGNIWFLHTFHKKTQQTPPQNIEIAKKRLGSVI